MMWGTGTSIANQHDVESNSRWDLPKWSFDMRIFERLNLGFGRGAFELDDVGGDQDSPSRG